MIDETKLRPWQVAGAKHLLEILKHHDSAIDCSDTGVGKTYVALAVAKAMQLPTLAIVPKIAISGWRAVAEYFDEPISIINYESVRQGTSDIGVWTNSASLRSGRRFTFVCCFCLRRFDEGGPVLPCVANAGGLHCVERKARPIVYGSFQFSQNIGLIIFDESHRGNGIKSLNAELIIAAKRQGVKHLLLSATPAQTILQMRALGYSLDLHSDKQHPSFYTWLRRHGARPDPIFRGMKWFRTAEQQKATMAELRAQVIPERGIRITTDEVPGFPPVDIQAVLCDIEGSEEINKIYETMEPALEALRTRMANDASPESPITTILRGRQKIELLKVPATVELAEDRLAQGFSVGVFCNFRATIVEVARRLNCDYIDGTVTGKRRDEIINNYQTNRSRALVLNSEACGVCIGLQDLDGNFPRFGIVSPPWSATVFKQLIGRFPRDGGKSKSHFRVLFAAGTVEGNVMRALRQKLSNLTALVDEDFDVVKTKF